MYRKYTPEEKLEIVTGYLQGKFSLEEKARQLGYKRAPGCFMRWVNAYREHGSDSLFPLLKNNTYTKEFKEKVVQEYLLGEGFSVELAAKYQISAADALLRWVELYNANIELKDYCPKKEVYMAESKRKTTIDERREILKHCLEHNRNYKETASIYDVSYSQVYSWVKKI